MIEVLNLKATCDWSSFVVGLLLCACLRTVYSQDLQWSLELPRTCSNIIPSILASFFFFLFFGASFLCHFSLAKLQPSNFATQQAQAFCPRSFFQQNCHGSQFARSLKQTFSCFSTHSFSDDDDQLVFETSKNVKVVPSFDDMGLSEDLLRGIYSYGLSSARLTTFNSAKVSRSLLPFSNVP